jgi:hypothetical protein
MLTAPMPIPACRSPKSAPFADAAQPFAELRFGSPHPMRYRDPVLSTGAIQ